MRNTLLDRLLKFIRERKAISLISKNSIVLDIGCGEGHFLKKIENKISKAYGIDPKAELFHNKKINLIKGDIEHLEFNIPKSDFITLLAVLEHFKNPELALANSFSLLKRGGKIILTTPAKKGRWVLEFLAWIRLIDEHEIKDHQKYFTKSEIERLLKSSGFKNIKVKSFELGYNLLITAEK